MVEASPKPERAAGGGGGGREEAKRHRLIGFPQASLEVPQVVAPDPKPVLPKNPVLPVAATVVADPMLVPPDARMLPYGDYKSRAPTRRLVQALETVSEPELVVVLDQVKVAVLDQVAAATSAEATSMPVVADQAVAAAVTILESLLVKVTSKARLISKPEPQYTEEARKNQITGTVVLKCVFSSNGTVTNIRTVSGLPNGLTERAIAAARQIKFVPATKDGHQVSMWMQLEYNFNLY